MKVIETDIYGANKHIDYFGDNTIIGYLQDKYPDGFNVPTDVMIDTKLIKVEDYDTVVGKYEVLIIVKKPAIAAALGITKAFWIWVVNTVALMALNMLVAKIFAPKMDNVDQGETSSVYNINNANNQAKIGSPIPVGYGTFRMYPSYVEKPYNVYEDNEEYLYLLLCIGQGDYNIESLSIGNQDVTNNADIIYSLVDKSKFNDIPGSLKGHFLGSSNNSTIKYDVNNRVELENKVYIFVIAGAKHTSKSPSLTIGTISYKLGNFKQNIYGGSFHGIKKAFEIVSFNSITQDYSTQYVMRTNTLPLPQNYEIDTTKSEWWAISKDCTVVELDIVAQAFRASTSKGAIIATQVTCTIELDGKPSTAMVWDDKSNSPLRKSIRIVTHGATKLRVSVNTKSDTSTIINTLIVQRVKELFPTPNVTEWGDISLLWVRAKATNGISQSGQSKVNGFFSRLDKSNNLKDVIKDIYSNKYYSAGLNVSDLSIPTITNSFNGVFETKGTIYDALDKSCKSQKYSIFPVGQNVVVKEDKVNPVSIHMFDETNILKGTFQAEYVFNEDSQYDGVKCSYRNKDTWELEEEVYPTTSIMPSDIELFGVTSKHKAEYMTKYFWKQGQARKMTVSFDTDIEGFSLEFLDKITIHHASIQDTHTVVYQAQTYGTNNIEIKFFGDVGEDEVVGLKVGDKITVRDNYGKPFTTTIKSVADDHHYTINPPIPNVVSCVKVGAKDYLITSVKPKNENTVTVSCVEYDASIYS